ncbi:hypothetical protein FQN57_006412 [Myotisia sp. PD_48]|nr:hypothetical protein FQN57_006412 [Myotisia sp. PD_48]
MFFPQTSGLFATTSTTISSVSIDTYPEMLEQELIATRQALQNTARVMNAESSSRLNARQTVDQRFIPATSTEMAPSFYHPNSVASTPGFSGLPQYSSYLGTASHISSQEEIHTEIPQRINYTTAGMGQIATQSSMSSYYPAFSQLESSQSQSPSADYSYYTATQFPSLYNQYSTAYDTVGYDEQYSVSPALPYTQQQHTNMVSSTNFCSPSPAPYLAVPPMESNTASSTPEMAPEGNFPEPRTPPSFMSSTTTSPIPVGDDDDLVGVGLYDEPLSASSWDDTMNEPAEPMLYSYQPKRKSLKLEETFDPSTIPTSSKEDDADEDEDDEDEEEEETSKEEIQESKREPEGVSGTAATSSMISTYPSYLPDPTTQSFPLNVSEFINRYGWKSIVPASLPMYHESYVPHYSAV